MLMQGDASPSLSAPTIHWQEQKKGIGHTDWRLQDRHYSAHFINATELLISKSAKGNTLGFGGLCFTATASSPLLSAEIPARTASCCHLCSQSQQALTSHPQWQVRAIPQPALQHSKPKQRNMELFAFSSASFFFPCVYMAGADPFYTPPI